MLLCAWEVQRNRHALRLCGGFMVAQVHLASYPQGATLPQLCSYVKSVSGADGGDAHSKEQDSKVEQLVQAALNLAPGEGLCTCFWQPALALCHWRKVCCSAAVCCCCCSRRRLHTDPPGWQRAHVVAHRHAGAAFPAPVGSRDSVCCKCVGKGVKQHFDATGCALQHAQGNPWKSFILSVWRRLDRAALVSVEDLSCTSPTWLTPRRLERYCVAPELRVRCVWFDVLSHGSAMHVPALYRRSLRTTTSCLSRTASSWATCIRMPACSRSRDRSFRARRQLSASWRACSSGSAR